MKKMIMVLLVTLLMTLILMGEKLADLPEVMKPNPSYLPIIIDGDQIIVTDGVRILIYSKIDYSLKKIFGKLGEGPQEFKGYDNNSSVITYLGPDTIVVNSLKKISFFTRSGDFIKEVRPATGYCFRPFGKGFLGNALVREEGERISSEAIKIYDSKFNVIKKVYQFKKFIQKGKKINPFEYRRPKPLIFGDKIFLNEINGVIHVFNKKGDEIYSIKPNYKKEKVTKEHKEKTYDIIRIDPRLKKNYEFYKQWIEFPKYFPPVRVYNISEGKIYIHTFRVKDEKSEFIIYSTKGKHLKTLFLPIKYYNFIEASPYTVSEGKIYQMVENIDEGGWVLFAYEIK
jgi:hypothetical protein